MTAERQAPPGGVSDGTADLEQVLASIGRPNVVDVPPDLGSTGRTHVFVVDDIVVKCDDRHGSSSMLRELAALELLADSNTDLPVPNALASGCFRDGRNWIVVNRLPGSPPPDRLAPAHELSTELARQLGELAARLHATTPPPPGFGTWTREPTRTLAEEEQHRIQILTRMAHEAEIVDNREITAVEQLLNDSIEAIAGLQVPVLAHRDVQPRNVLVDGQKVCALLDFESSAGGDPAEDFKMVALDWSAPGFAAFERGYHDAGGRLGEDGPERIAHHVLNWALVVFAYLGAISPRYLAPARTAVARIRDGERPVLTESARLTGP